MSQVNPNQINQMHVVLQPNSSNWEDGVYKPQTTSKKIDDYLDKSSGSYRFLQLCDKVCKVLSFGTFGTQIFKDASEIFGKGASVLIYPRVLPAFNSAVDATYSLFKTSSLPGALRRKCVTAVQDVSSFVSTVGYAAAPLLKLSAKTASLASPVLNVAEKTTLVSDICDFQKNSEDALKARSLAKRAQKLDVSSELKQALAETQKFHMLKVAKAMCSLLGVALGLSLTISGVAILPGCALLAATVSLAGTSLASIADLYESGMKYEKVKFFNDKHVQIVPEFVVTA